MVGVRDMVPDSRMTVTWDGHDLTELFLVTNIARSWPSLSASTTDNPAGGSFLVGLRPQSPTVSMTLRAYGDSSRRREAARALASWLAVDGPRELAFGDDGGLCYMAVPDGSADSKRLYWQEAVAISFLVPEPVMLGDRMTATVPSGATASVGVGGTAPARPVIVATAAVRDSSTGLWGVRDTASGDFVRVALPTASPSAVTIDCERRTATVNGQSALVTLDSDWLELAPGAHALAVDGTGDATLTWRERWLT